MSRELIPVLARVRDFLPMMASSNEALAAKKPEEVNMEDTEGDEQVIAMVRDGRSWGTGS